MKNRFRAAVGVIAGIWLSFSFGSAAYAQARLKDSAAVKKEAIVGNRDQGSGIKINFKEDSPMGTKDSSSEDDEKIVSALDTEYQEAVKHHDAAPTGVVQERTACPRAITVQQPHWPRPQPNFGPFNCRSSASTYSSGVAGSTSRVCFDDAA